MLSPPHPLVSMSSDTQSEAAGCFSQPISLLEGWLLQREGLETIATIRRHMGRKEPSEELDSDHNLSVPFLPSHPLTPPKKNKRKVVKKICQKNVPGKVSVILHTLKENEREVELRKRTQKKR